MRNASSEKRVCCSRALLGLAFLCLLPRFALAADSHDIRFLEGLRQRRLFELAAGFCEQRLADQNLSPADRAIFTIELARSDAGKALHAARAERDELWQAATGVLSEFTRRNPSHPRLFLVRLQEALIVLARAELARQESEVAADAEQSLAAAREQIREAARLLEELEKDLEREIPRRLNARAAEGELTSDELSSLLDNVRFQLARAYRNQALTYEAHSADRVNSLSQAARRLSEVRQSAGEGTELYWSSRLGLAVCDRLLERLPEAAQQLEALKSQNLPLAVLLEARAERARLALAAGQLEQALAAIAEGRTAGGQTSPELDFAHLQTYVALWKQAEAQKNAADSAAWREKAVAMTRLIEESHGPYWRRRADALLTGSASSSEAPADLEILVRTARDHYLRKRLDDAVEAYDAAAQHARGAGDSAQAFDLFYKAAAIEHQRQNRSEAARRFRELAVSLPTHAQAAEAHLLGCFNLAQAAREDAARLDEYGAALEEHLRYWPDQADQARIWLGKLRESQGRWQAAVDAYRGVSPMHQEYEAAIAGATRSWLRRLAEMDPTNADRAAEANDAAEFFESVVSATKSDSSAGEIAASRAAAIAAAKVRLESSPDGHARAEQVLRGALNSDSSAPPEWRAEATGLLVVALAGQPSRVLEAQAMLRGAVDTKPQKRWEMIQSLAALAEESPPNIRPQLAKLVLDAIDSLGAAQLQLSPTDQITAQRVRANALAGAGRAEEARTLLEQLARKHPQDARIQEGYGELLLTFADSAAREAALRQWRIIAQGSRPRTERWWRAKYNIALVHFQNGDREQAAQLIRYLQEVPPGLDDSPLKEQFLELLERCQ
jgi:hypothetical protein